MLNVDMALKNNELFIVGRAHPAMPIPEPGVYARDSRFLAPLELHLNDTLVTDWTPTAIEPDAITLHATVAGATADVRLALTDALAVTVTIAADQPVRSSIRLGADFRDMFEIRGFHADRRPQLQTPVIGEGSVTFSAIGSDGERIGTTVSLPEGWDARIDDEGEQPILVLAREVADGESATADLTATFQPVGAPFHSAGDAGHLARVEVPADDSPWATFLAQSDRDLALLMTSFPDGAMPAAGIPWYIAPFGRDSLITALQTMDVYPERAASTLRVLAKLQGTKVDAYREEQPGKIPHEMRYGDLARSGQIPHTPYYGSIDATPLFIMTFARYVLQENDAELFHDLLPHVRQALVWIATDGDKDGDGFLEFAGTNPDDAHISQQGWKDSGDSLHFADGRSVQGPIALVEVQGYVCAAYLWLADAMDRFGEAAEAADLCAKGEAVRQRIEDAFWMDDADCYAQALDGDKAQVDAISSNPGHLLFCGVPSQKRADRLIATLFSPEMNGGWGTRTLSTAMATYDPESYHNGSVWPHDVSLIMAGCAAYGHADRARELRDQITALASYTDGWRISELYCGYPREEGKGPVPYEVSCTPQAWSAAAAVLGHACVPEE